MQSAVGLSATLLRVASRCPTLRPATYLEIAAFAAGVKPAVRFVVSRHDAERLHAAARSLGLCFGHDEVFIVPHANGWNEVVSYQTPNSQSLVVLTHNATASTLIRAEINDPMRAGEMLGYPACCVDALADISAAGEKWAIRLLEQAPEPINARLNRFAAEWGGIGLMGELFPCTLGCIAAAAYSQSLYDAAVSVGLERLAGQARSDALVPVSVTNTGKVHRGRDGHSVEFFW